VCVCVCVCVCRAAATDRRGKSSREMEIEGDKVGE
jgi:hypothetical protein